MSQLQFNRAVSGESKRNLMKNCSQQLSLTESEVNEHYSITSRLIMIGREV